MAAQLASSDTMDWTMTDVDVDINFPLGQVNNLTAPERKVGDGKFFDTDRQKRKIMPKEHWELLKSVIQRLYVEEDRTLPQVIQFLTEHHGLSPTKRQLLPRISAWGMEKIVKRKERRAILRNLETEGVRADIGEGALGSRKYNKAKIERWKRAEAEEEATINLRVGNMRVTPTIAPSQTHGKVPAHSSLGPSEVQKSVNDISLARSGAHHEEIFDPWTTANVLGSPRLTGFIGRLMLELEDDLKALDLSASNHEYDGEEDVLDFQIPSTQPSYIAALTESSKKHYHFQIPDPFKELSPFPKVHPRQPQIVLLGFRNDHLNDPSALKTKEIECMSKMKSRRILDRLQLLQLVQDMRDIASRHYELHHYQIPEIWWRRVVDCSRRIPAYQAAKILEACLWVINSSFLCGKVVESRKLHEAVHQRVRGLFHPDDELNLFSRRILGDILMFFGEYQTGEDLRRGVIQIYLSKYGPRSQSFFRALRRLSATLFSSGKIREAETILCLGIQLHRDILNYQGGSQWARENTLAAMCALALVLNCQISQTQLFFSLVPF